MSASDARFRTHFQRPDLIRGFTLLRLGGTQADVGGPGEAFAALKAPFRALDVADAEPRAVYGYDLLLRPICT
jgi:hypothetical protein